MESQCQMLPNIPYVAAVYVSLWGPGGRNPLASTRQKLQELFTRVEGNSLSCHMHLLLFTEFISDRALAALVPINALRNAALLLAKTPFASMIDVDFSPSYSFHLILQNSTRLLRPFLPYQ
ncbi:hypothetical protein TSOC_014168 [Tetrabaena socialis]|uniref:Uncharacterized protein n=1 Tax=Tetrabaena socialis TaxID=47790 RepID=A0A2J7ZID0_9CHLO|nr:hypothetical protein TSOC_014168 [Tetrabaena socialis]|eukprot:PNH00031.1 hypothetical protein TSOC_014168 [Tetrabaena socialis]